MLNRLYAQAEMYLRDIGARDFMGRFRHYNARANHGDLVNHVATFYYRRAFKNV